MSAVVLPSVRPGLTVEVTREPVGVVALVIPWNFPIAIPAWKIAPALAFGNCVVFKPAEPVPGSAWELVKILQEAVAHSLPSGERIKWASNVQCRVWMQLMASSSASSDEA